MDELALVHRPRELAALVVSAGVDSPILREVERVRVPGCNLAYLLIDIDCGGLEPQVVLVRFVDPELAEVVVPARFDLAVAVQEEREVATARGLGDVEELVDELRSISRGNGRAEPKGSLGVQTPRVHLALPVDGDGVLPAA